MELRDIYELWDRFDRSAVDEMELNMHGDSFHLRKGSPCVTSSSNEQIYGEQPASTFSGNGMIPVESMVASSSKEASVEEKAQEEKLHTVEIKAPLVGTFYVASSPDAEPFIQVGQEVHKGDVIGIIEAMKLMNEVVADADGTVVEILAEDGKMVEYDQVLVRLA